MLSNNKMQHLLALWFIGDWEALNNILESDIERNNESTLLLASALYQLGRPSDAKSLLSNIQLSNEQRRLAFRLFTSGVYTSLGKAYICDGNHKKGELFFSKGLTQIQDEPTPPSTLRARISEQFFQLGIPYLNKKTESPTLQSSIEDHLNIAKDYFPSDPAIHLALAEFYQLNERYDEAVVCWQKICEFLDGEMPQAYYDRLKDAYKSMKAFPLGTEQQESLRGDADKHQILKNIHQSFQPDLYLEIGVQTGKSLALASCEAIGIDPMPMINIRLPESAKVITSSSDAFFKKQVDFLLTKQIDLCFIDGMHLFEYALRDFINVEKYSAPHSLIIIDDIFPNHKSQANRERCTRAWTGDVWKLKEALEKYRPDLYIQSLDTYPTGLMFITALDPKNQILDDKYEEIVDYYLSIKDVPSEIINRNGAVPSDSKIIYHIIEKLKQARKNNISVRADALKQFIEQMPKDSDL